MHKIDTKNAWWRRGFSCIKERRLPCLLKEKLRLLVNFLKYGTSDIFSHIFIDTITACNRRCYYCPNSKSDRGSMQNMKKMDTELFHKIIDELVELKWKGEIAPNFYGEPLLDNRMPDLIKYVRDKLPDSTVTLITNGDFLTVDLYKKLVKAGLNSFFITQHPNGSHKNVAKVLEYRKRYGDDNVKVQYSALTIIYNRGGVVEIGEEINDKGCRNAVLNNFGVDYDGNLIFCCNDYFVTVKFGNIKNERLIDIWNKPYYKQIRKDLRNGIYRLEVCKECKRGTVPTSN